MSDGESDSGGDRPSGPNRGLIAIVAVALIGAVVAAVALIGGDDDESGDDATTVAPASSAEPDTTDSSTPSTEAPTTSVASVATTAAETTTAPEATEAPATTDAPADTDPVPYELSFAIEAIEDGGTIPIEFTCDGANTAPTVVIDAIPEGVLQLAMLVDDPDAPTDDPFVHWVVYGIPGNSLGFSDADPTLTYGTNDVGLTEWFGPCPPAGDGPHGYVFSMFGLRQELTLDPGLDGREFRAAIDGSVVAESSLTASYERR